MKKIFSTLALVLLQPALCFGYIQFTGKGIDGSGNSWAVAQNMVDDISTIEAVYTPFGSDMQSPITVSDPLLWSDAPRIAMNKNGDAVIIWSAYDPNVDARLVFATVRPNTATSWSTPVTLSGYDEIVLSDYQVRIDDDGDVVVGWNAYIKEYDYTFSIINGNVHGINPAGDIWYPAERFPQS